jgi:ACS family hexuronate transporter-like MFS transporter
MNEKIGRYRWTICALVFFATTINYLDRQVISLLKPYLEDAFHWTEKDYSYIVMAFQFAYAIGLIGFGRFIDKIGTKLGYALSLTVWSIAAIGHALARSTFGFGVARAVLGLSEAGNFPAAIKTVAEWFPKKERALATGIFNSGSNVGAIIAPLVVPWIAITWGWQEAFIITGAIGFVWLVLWFIYYEVPAKQKRLSKVEFDYIHSDPDSVTDDSDRSVSWLKLLGFRQTWAFIIGKFMTDPIWWFLLFWLPSFLKTEYGMTGTQVGLPIAMVYIMTTFGSIGGGWISGYLIRKGWPVYRARKISMLGFALCVLPVVSAQALGAISPWMAIIVIGIAASAHQAWSANIFTTVSDMFPKNAVGSVVGIGGMAGAIGGLLISWFTGLILDHYRLLGHIQTGYYILFIIAGLAYVTAWLIMHLLAPKQEKILMIQLESGIQNDTV